MKGFNPQLKIELQQFQAVLKPAPTPPAQPKPYKPSPVVSKRELIAGGDILWKPVNRQASHLLGKAHWLCQPCHAQPEPPPQPQPKKKKERTYMTKEERAAIAGSGFEQKGSAIRTKVVDGELYVKTDDLQRVMIEEIKRMPKETRPMVVAAEQARDAVGALLHGVGHEIEEFQKRSPEWTAYLREKRYTVVAETSTMIKALGDLRQFFLGSDYETERKRLEEFVTLCERLQKLKESGFLDAVADTMLRIAEPKG